LGLTANSEYFHIRARVDCRGAFGRERLIEICDELDLVVEHPDVLDCGSVEIELPHDLEDS